MIKQSPAKSEIGKLLIICGPTATGKTSLGFNLARKFGGEIISADSRQVFKGMDVGTGKEWSKEIKIWGYDLVDPKREFSVSKFLKFARKTLEDIWSRGKLPIVVGGTGLYLRAIIDGIPTVEIPINKKLREKLEEKDVNSLFENLSQLDAVRAGSMNTSDKKNPRRLIRAIEVATWKLGHGESARSYSVSTKGSILMIGLTATKDVLDERIVKRVKQRLEMGIEKEISDLLASGISWSDQSMQALGYRQWRDYFEGGAPKEVVIDEWIREEEKYAKRQMVWFKKDKRVDWFDITSDKYQKEVEKLVKKWYINPDA